MIVALGLDVGERRIGVAKSDATGLLASPLTAVVRESDRAAISAIRALVEEHSASIIVVGLPLGPDGEVTEQAERVRAFGRKLRAIPGARVVFSDERFTTETAQEALRVVRPRRGAPSARRREADRRRVDAAAAAVILQDYLDQERRASVSTPTEIRAEPPPEP